LQDKKAIMNASNLKKSKVKYVGAEGKL